MKAQTQSKMNRFRWIFIATGFIIVATVGYLALNTVRQSKASTHANTPPVYHGGACDDQAYYTKHERECAVQ